MKTTTPKVCFHSGVRDMKDFWHSTWYKYDIEILRSLGCDVRVSQSRLDVPLSSDLYFAWWPTTGAAACLAAVLRQRPFVVVAGSSDLIHDFQGVEREFGFYSRSWATRRLIQQTLSRADRILAVSNHAAEQATTLASCKDVRLVPLAIDTEAYEPSALGYGRTLDIVCIVAILTEIQTQRKKLIPLLRALPEVIRLFPDARLRIIGEKGNAFPALQMLVQELGVERNVQFLGRLSERDKIRALQDACVYVQPTKHECFGVAIAEAMSCGIPVITSPVGAVPEVVGDCGFYTGAEDSRKIKEHLITLLQNPTAAANMGQRARKRILANYTFAQRQTKMKEAISDLL